MRKMTSRIAYVSGGIEDRGDWWAGVGQVMEYVTVADSVGDGA